MTPPAVDAGEPDRPAPAGKRENPTGRSHTPTKEKAARSANGKTN